MVLSILKMKCPKCHKGNLFIDVNPYHLSKVDKMPERCPVCRQHFQPEPGFYYGAMYISYGIGVILFMIGFLIMEIILQIQGYSFIIGYSLLLLILWPVLFRYARVIYIYLFVRYDKNADKSPE